MQSHCSFEAEALHSRGRGPGLRTKVSASCPRAAQRTPYLVEIDSGKTLAPRRDSISVRARPRCPDSTKITALCYFRTLTALSPATNTLRIYIGIILK